MSPTPVETALATLEKELNRPLAVALEDCARCGICAETCHYYLADPKPENVPAARAEGLRNARMLYVALAGAHTILPAASIFETLGADWTLSIFEAANYGIFLGDASRAEQIARRIVDEATQLGVEEIVISECGHAYYAMRWLAPI